VQAEARTGITWLCKETMMTWKYFFALMLLAGSALADHNAVQLDKLILGLVRYSVLACCASH